jgi:two-component system nitrogen regulation response regulator GlnG
LPAQPISAVVRRSPPFDPFKDTCLSRDPFLSIVSTDREIEIRPGNTRTAVAVNGTRLDGPRAFSTFEAKAGIILLLGHEIVVCLHQIEVPVERGPQLGLVGDSDVIERVRRQILDVAGLDAPVLVRGETGTGKELVAAAIQREGPRADKPFVMVNLAEVPAETAASLFFGHVRGAFTGAARDHAGFFAQADGGTLLLDEVALAVPPVPNMLLRVIETGQIRPIGSGRSRKVQVRLICATDEKLERASHEGRFSNPLFQRLSRLQIRLPLLRERREDLGSLFLHFLRRDLATVGESGRLDADRFRNDEAPWLAAPDFAKIALADFPGNVRTLENIATRLVAASRGKRHATFNDQVEELVSATTPTEEPVRRPGGRPPKVTDEQIRSALERHNNNVSAAAADLGIHRDTLYERMANRSQGIRSTSTLSDEEVLASRARHHADLDAMAADLGVSRKGLAARLRQALARMKRD